MKMQPLAVLSTAVLPLLSAPALVAAEATVRPVYATETQTGSNADSCASWVAPEGGTSLLFVTEKEGDRIEVWDASTGAAHAARPFLGGVANGSAPGEFNRPNGVLVVYRVPHPGGFVDVLLVTDQLNQRVQALRLPALEPFGQFGTGEVGKGYGLASWHDGADHFAIVTDNAPPTAFPGKIKVYRLRADGAGLGADLVRAAGSSSGVPALANVESVAADPWHDRLHVCGDEGGRLIWLFRLDLVFTGIDYGDPQFEYDQEGINIYDTGFGRGYLVVSDQYTNGAPNQFELFDRETLATFGRFVSAPAGPIITRNTDGAWLEQRPLEGFPNGAFFAVHDDKNAHAYDWTDVAEAMNLELRAPDRPFPAARPSEATGRRPSRKSAWFHDGSSWALLPSLGAWALSRFEDGVWVMRRALSGSGDALPAARGAELRILRTGSSPRIERDLYVESLRAYETSEVPVSIPYAVEGPADFALEPALDAAGAPAWIAWVEGAFLRVLQVGPEGVAEGVEPTHLGEAHSGAPRWILLPDAIAILWDGPEGAVLRMHRVGDPPELWSAAEIVRAVETEGLEGLDGVALSEGRILVVGSTALGETWMRARAESGGWSPVEPSLSLRDPILAFDPEAEEVHLLGMVERSGRRLVHHLRATAALLDFDAPRFLVGWPGVDQEFLVGPRELSPLAREFAVAGLGDDGHGYPARVSLARSGDLIPPVSLQHLPAPGSTDVPPGALVSFRLLDDSSGVDRSSIRLTLAGREVVPTIRGVPRNLLVSAEAPADLGSRIQVRIEARDLSEPPRVMTPFEYEYGDGSVSPPRFQRGDSNDDGQLDISDALRVLLFLFAGVEDPACADAADANDDGAIDVSDAVFLLGYLFTGGEALPMPGESCGEDPTMDGLPCVTSRCP